MAKQASLLGRGLSTYPPRHPGPTFQRLSPTHLQRRLMWFWSLQASIFCRPHKVLESQLSSQESAKSFTRTCWLCGADLWESLSREPCNTHSALDTAPDEAVGCHLRGVSGQRSTHSFSCSGHTPTPWLSPLSHLQVPRAFFPFGPKTH